MNFKEEKYILNRSRLYLLPFLFSLDPKIRSIYRKLPVKAVAIGDSASRYPVGGCLFIVVEVQNDILTNISNDVNLNSLESNYLCIDRYSCIIDSSPYEVLVFKMPERFASILQKFLAGKYSEMYTKEEQRKIPFSVAARRVIEKNKNCKKEFIVKINKKFSTTLVESDFPDMDIDFPPELAEEVINY